MVTFQLSVSYTQVAVFLSSLAKPFNNWTDRHVAQGFSWRPGSVSFRTLDDGDVDVTVLTEDSHPEPTMAERIIRVPFHVPPGGVVEIGSIFDSVKVNIPSGDYAIIFEHGRAANDRMWCALIFDSAQRDSPAEILRADPELTSDGDLLMSADPA